MSVLPPVLILDGGLGTTLVDQFGFNHDNSNSLWSSQLLLSTSGMETLKQCHSAFVDAGADLVTTATYQVSMREIIRVLAETAEIKEIEVKYDAEQGNRDTESAQAKNSLCCKSEKNINYQVSMAKTYMRNAIHLVRTSFGEGKGKVVLGFGAAGACLKPSQEYTGNYSGSEVGTSVKSIRGWHLERICVFTNEEMGSMLGPFSGSCWSEVDLVAFETIPLLQEIVAIREAMSQVHDELERVVKSASRKDFWISCVFPGDSFCLPDGSPIIEVIRAMLGKRDYTHTPIAVGINCTRLGKLEPLIEKYEAAINEMILNQEIENWPGLVVYPDRTNGEVYNTQTRQWEVKQGLGSYSCSWDEMMYRIINRTRKRGYWKSIYAGGCCKASPEDIKKLSLRFKAE